MKLRTIRRTWKESKLKKAAAWLKAAALIAAIFLSLCTAATALENISESMIRITEIMYNPIGSDNNREFIEIYLGKNISLENYTIADSSSSDSLHILSHGKGHESSYALIVEDGFDYSNMECAVYGAGPTIGNSLNNNKDEIRLYNKEGKLVAFASYNNSLANGNGKTIEIFNSKAYESNNAGGSPCRAFILNSSISISNSANKSNKEYKSSYNESKKENNSSHKEYKSYGEENHSLTGNENCLSSGDCGLSCNSSSIFHNATNNTRYGNSPNCTEKKEAKGKESCSIGIMAESLIVNESSRLVFWFKLLCENKTLSQKEAEEKSYSINYYIKTGYGDFAKRPYESRSLAKKSWLAKCSKDKKNSGFIIFAELKKGNITISKSKKAAVVLCSKENTKESNNISMESSLKLYLEKESAVFGSTIPLSLLIKKGNTRKKSVKLWIENKAKKRASETASITISKGNELSLKVMLGLKDSCKAGLKSGIYMVVAEGLGKRAVERLFITGECKEAAEYKKGAVTNSKKATITGNEQESNSQRTAKKGTENKTRAIIKSFYCLSRYLKPEIKLFSTISKKPCIAVLKTKKSIISCSYANTTRLSFSIEPKNNSSYTLEIYCKANISSMKKISQKASKKSLVEYCKEAIKKETADDRKELVLSLISSKKPATDIAIKRGSKRGTI